MPVPSYRRNQKLNLTATNSSIKGVPNGPRTHLDSILVAQASNTPTLKVADDSGNIMDTITPTAGTSYPMPCEVQGTLVITVSGTVDLTVFYGTD